MADAEIHSARSRRVAPIWWVPILAAVLGAGMVIHSIRSQGPTITIVFDTATGIEAEKTKIRTLAVQVGVVESVHLAEGHKEVIVKARLDKSAEPLLREDTQFWVVRPRVGATGISGLGTALSGAYIQLAPGTQREGRRDFDGLEEPPVTPVGAPGLHFELVSDGESTVGAGAPILYEGFRIGRVERSELDIQSSRIRYSAFIDAPYDELVTTNTRFWDVSGVSVRAGSSGVELRTGSLESILIGGVAMGRPIGLEAGRPVEDDEVFRLYPDYATVNEHPYRTSLAYVATFAQSVRGLQEGAPVEYRGIKIGSVERILVEEMTDLEIDRPGSAIPVLLKFEPGLLSLPDDGVGAERLRGAIEGGVATGLRASLETGNLLTGSRYIRFDYYPDEPPAPVGRFAEWKTIPTISTGIEGTLQQARKVLKKIDDLPLERTVREANRTLASLNEVIASDAVQGLPAELDATLAELQATLASVSPGSPLQTRLLRTATELERSLQSLRRLLDTLDANPNAIIFNHDPGPDPEPPSGRP